MTGFPRVGDRFGRYQITGFVGRGGMGVVFVAVQDGLDRKVALKLLAPELALDEQFRDRFILEASALATLDSPHIIHIYECGEQDGCLFIATQLATGGDLWDHIEAVGALPPRQALGIVAQVAAALDDAHKAGVVHRDIKPANVLLHRFSDEIFTYLCDFGIAQTSDGNRTRTGELIGTLGYMAPERHEGARATEASDIYSLGCLLWTALTGSPPYDGTDVQVATAHQRAPVPTWLGDDQASRAVNAILQRSMAKNPEDRFESAALMRTHLLAARSQLPDSESTVSTSRSDTLTVPLDEPPPRRRPRSLLVAGLVAGFVAAIAVAAVGAVALRLSTDGESPGTAPAQVTCWTGLQVDSPDQCSIPSGVAGMRWVYPSFDKDFAGCEVVRNPVAAKKVRAWFCPFAGNPDEGVRYNEWRSPSDARDYHDANYRPYTAEPFRLGDSTVGDVWRRLSPGEYGLVSTAMVYREWPFSVSVQSERLAGLDAGCKLVAIRSPVDFATTSLECPAR